jgi:hypothetical protein
LVELPPEIRTKYEEKLEACRLAWEKSRDPRAVVDAMWWADNLQQPRPAWLEQVAAKFPSDIGFVNAMHIHASMGPRGTPQRHWGPVQYAEYAIQMLYPNVPENISRRKLVKEVRQFLPTDPYFRATGLKVPGRRTIERALDRC